MDRNYAMNFIVLMGFVGMFGDIAYEGGRSMIGPFMAYLGASAVAVGFVSGLGEFLGYALRLVFGFAADRKRDYWLFTFLGYALIFSIPLLALAGNWQVAAIFIILERVGKAVRSPARDAILSYATKKVGRGWGFAIHEALDQAGAIAGPLAFAAIFAFKSNFRLGFGFLAIPAALTLITLVFAFLKARSPEDFEAIKKERHVTTEKESFSPAFWHYAVFSALCVAGFINYQIISYHWDVKHILPGTWIPFIYAFAMGIDGLAALAAGKLYDRVGLKVLGVIPFFTILLPFSVFLTSGMTMAFLTAAIWGVIMGLHETVMRAAIADLTHIQKRGLAYGLFNALYGGAWFVGSFAAGWLYDRGQVFIFLFVFLMEFLALGVFLKFIKTRNT